MKIIIVGSSGTIGSSVLKELGQKHEVIGVSRNSKTLQVDMRSESSIQKMYQKIGSFDALVSCAGETFWGDFASTREHDFNIGVQSKLMGQINLVRVGLEFIKKNGSFTLTSGILATEPAFRGVNASTVNGALNSFVMAAAAELKDGIRINAVSPGLVEESVKTFEGYFSGHVPVEMKRVTAAYVKSIEEIITGKVLSIY